jgi:PAS domain S-box-containing protein
MKASEQARGVLEPLGSSLGHVQNGPNSQKDITPLLKTVNKWLAGVIIFFALFGLLTWQFDPETFAMISPGLASMDPLTAFSFICAACGLLASQSDRKEVRSRGAVFALLLIIMAILELANTLFDLQLLNSFLIEKNSAPLIGNETAGTPLSAPVCFLFAGSGILLLDRRISRDTLPSQYFALVTSLAGLFSTMIYIYRVKDGGFFSYIQMTASSGICFALVGTGMLFTRPSQGFMKEFTGRFIGGSTARALIPFAIVVPISLGLLRLLGHWSGLISTEAGVLLLVFSIIAAFLWLINYSTGLLNKHDEEEHQTAMKLAETNEVLERRVFERTSELVKSERQFRSLIENSSDILSLADKNMQLLYRSPAAERILGWTMNDRLESKGSIGSTHPDDIEYVNRVITEILKQPGRSLPVTFRTRHKLGHYLWVEGMVTNMLYDESVRAIVTNFKDVTIEKIASDRFRLVVEGSPLGKVLLNAKGEITLVNSKTESLFGYERRDLIGQNISILIPSDYWLKFVASSADGQIIKNKDAAVLGVELLAKRKNGSEFAVEIGFNPIEAGEGMVVLVSILDITSRKSAEARLAQSSSQLRQTAADLQLTVDRFKRTEEIASIGHWFFDMATQETVWSDETFRLFGLEPQKCKPSLELFFSRIHPDDLEMVRSVQKESERNFSPFSIMHRIKIERGLEKHLYSVATYELDEAGKALRLYGASMDVTALKQTEQKLTDYHQRHELLSKATNEAIWDWDMKNNTVLWNHGIETIFGYENRTLESTESWWQARIHPDDTKRIGSQMQQSFDNRQSKLTLEYRYECADKSYKYVLDKAYVVYHESEPVRVIGAMQDVTELMQYRHGLEKMVEARTHALNAALEKEKELVAVKSKFVSIASHEFRTPLSTIALAAGFIKRHKNKLSSADIDRKLENIDKQVSQMTYLLDDILTVGKGEAGKLLVKMEEMDVKTFKRLAQEAIQSTAKKHKLVFSQECERDIIVTDEKLIRNIIINLVTNAVKFSPDADRVVMDVRASDELLMMRVQDYGMGIPEKDIPNLFNTFSRGSNVAEIEGTGLGLSIVKKAVDMLNGQIEVRSEIKKGTEFQISIPI